MRRIAAILLLLAVALAAALADVPVRTEQMIWSILAFNGRDYSPAFAPESSDTIYLLAGADNFLSARKTLLYWWSITSEWRTDTESLNVQFPGTLELRDGRGSVTKLPLEEYTYFNVKGEYELNWNVVTGEAARQELAKYAALYESYFKAMQDYQRQIAEYDAEMQSLGARIQKLREQGGDFSALLTRMQTLPRPAEPAAPSYYVVPPSDMQQAFILNLSPGSYRIRLLNSDGSVMESTEKTVIVHDRSRSNGIGFEVIPSDRWTRPEASVTPSSVLYVERRAPTCTCARTSRRSSTTSPTRRPSTTPRGATRTSRSGSASSRCRTRRSCSRDPAPGRHPDRAALLRGAVKGLQPRLYHHAL